MIFDSGSNFDSLNDDSGSRFIYAWVSVDDSRSRISNFLYDSRSRFNLWLVTRGQELILIERLFARLWGLNDWFWRLFLKCLWRFFNEEVFPWRFFIVSIFGDSHCNDFLLLEIFSWMFCFFFFEIVPLWRFVQYATWGLKIVLVCSYWGLKSLCWLFGSGSLA